MTNPAAGMPCPVCQVPLVMSDRQGVEIDYCPQCRGVWLDRGELDKIIQRTVERDVAPLVAPRLTPQAPQPHYGNDYGHYRPDKRGYPKRKKSFLEELFD